MRRQPDVGAPALETNIGASALAGGRRSTKSQISPMIDLTSDAHFGDPRFLRFERRRLPNMAEHNVMLIRNWNETVSRTPVSWGRDVGECRRLQRTARDRKHLIVGNNDPETTTILAGWAQRGE